MPEEEIMLLLRAIKEQLNRVESCQVEMLERQKLIGEQPVQGSFASE
jgi:hypothetical protein